MSRKAPAPKKSGMVKVIPTKQVPIAKKASPAVLEISTTLVVEDIGDRPEDKAEAEDLASHSRVCFPATLRLCSLITFANVTFRCAKSASKADLYCSVNAAETSVGAASARRVLTVWRASLRL